MFDPSAPHIIILLVVVLLLFGSTRLPGAAKAIGKSMHIFKRSVKGLDDDDDNPGESPTSGPTVTTVMTPNQRQLASTQADSAQQAQIDALQRQLNDLQRQPATGQQSSDSAAAGRPDTRSY
jgi:sec-independent protein translocase protein TatA